MLAMRPRMVIPRIQELLLEFQDLFEESHVLPPNRECDHKIPLKAGAEPINLRPYKYSSLQKDILEQLIKDMLVTGVI